MKKQELVQKTKTHQIEKKNKKQFILKKILKRIVKPSLIVAFLSYLFISLFTPRGIAYVLMNHYCSSNSLDLETLNQTYYYGVDNGNEYFKAYSFCKGWQMFITSIIALVFVLIFTRDLIKEDIIKIKENPKFYLKWIGIIALPFGLGVWMLSYCFSNFGISNNETTLRFIFKNGGALPIVLTALLIAPLLEELIFRKCLWTFIKKFDWMHISFSYGVSTLFFAVPHLLTTQYVNFGLWLVMIIPYFVAGLGLAFIYHKGKENTFASFTAHFTNNLITVIFLLIL